VFEDTKGVLRIIRISKKDTQYNCQQKRDKRTKHNIQNITQKTKDRTTRTQRKSMGEHRMAAQFLLHMRHPSCYSCYKHWYKS